MSTKPPEFVNHPSVAGRDPLSPLERTAVLCRNQLESELGPGILAFLSAESLHPHLCWFRDRILDTVAKFAEAEAAEQDDDEPEFLPSDLLRSFAEKVRRLS